MFDKKMILPEEYLPADENGKAVREELAKTVRETKENGIPVVILFEGWGGSGKGYMIEKLISELDPRGFKVWSIGDANEAEQRFPMLYRFWEKLPSSGKLSIFDRSWYREVSNSFIEQDLTKKTVNRYMRDILEFEKQMTDDKTVIIKFFLHISKKEQAARFKALSENPATRWRVTQDDLSRHKCYDDYAEVFEDMVEKTDTENAPWNVIFADNKKAASAVVCRIVNETLKAAIAKKSQPKPPLHVKDDAIDYSLAETIHHNDIPSDVRTDSSISPKPILPLDRYDLTLDLDDETYRSELKRLQKELFTLHNKLYRRKIPLILVFEGWDAAGKGGAIKRLTSGLDPRGFEVVPISAPTQTELSYPYMRRFWTALPKSGHIGIFDRSWYGRVMVERLEGFAKRDEWGRAFDEMNKFERTLSDSGAIIVKFWLHISDEEQLVRFNERVNTPEKQWKITDEDWRNRDKRLGYHISVDQMLALTNTSFAPWVVVEANSKKYARIKVLQTVVDVLHDKL